MPDRLDRFRISPIRVLIAEDEALLRTAVAELLPQVAGSVVKVVSTCATRSQMLRDTRHLRPDVVLVDLRMPDRDGLLCTLGGAETIAALQRQWTEVRVICLSVHAEPDLVRACLDAGAAGYLGKGVLPEELWRAVRSVALGGRYVEPMLQARLDMHIAGAEAEVRSQLLAGRRGDVLRLLLEGHSPAEIAATLPITKKYVDKKIAEIKALLGVDTTIRIYRLCRELGLVDD
ncbi:response regulator transcription factor [Thiocystis violascens]|uniref:Response regulator containing a CheY-like receiver domain and an HTH DNA-binding domain n=1 Tax=Thiocystis violascens (strain ATCC 17096 / DSM 198 / 6111) TaxID=765911 RepID=I3Y8X8_THIV6|nr:response regulator transcription factor [Thiocystis violascens]AFL73446.1 response regulator containing a CheY-like receiver domain and an HTH DNA-binding domain [Thiocystis violascens DSM 198]